MGSWRVSRRQLEDLDDLGRPLDRPRVVEHGAVVHRLLGDLAEAVLADADLAQPSRQTQRLDQAGHEIGRWRVRLAERLAHALLALGIGGKISAPPPGQHYPRRMALRHLAGGAPHQGPAPAGAPTPPPGAAPPPQPPT